MSKVHLLSGTSSTYLYATLEFSGQAKKSEGIQEGSTKTGLDDWLTVGSSENELIVATTASTKKIPRKTFVVVEAFLGGSKWGCVTLEDYSQNSRMRVKKLKK